MTTTSTRADGVVTTGSGWKRRLAVVVGAVLATLVVFIIETVGIDLDVRTPAGGGRDAADLPAAAVVLASATASLVAWALLAILERFTARAHTIWTALAVLALLVSFVPALSGSGVNGESRVGLVLLHITVAAVLIPLLPGNWPGHVRRPLS